MTHAEGAHALTPTALNAPNAGEVREWRLKADSSIWVAVNWALAGVRTCVCACECVHACMCMHACAWVGACTYPNSYDHANLCMRTCTCARTDVGNQSIHFFVLCVCVNTEVCVRLHLCLYVHACVF